MSMGPLPPRTVEGMYRKHLAEMRSYATEIAATLGEDSAIVKRIRSCADSNEAALNHLSPPKCGECGKPKA